MKINSNRREFSAVVKNGSYVIIEILYLDGDEDAADKLPRM